MRPIVTVVAWLVCLMVTGVRCAKTAEPIEMQCGMWTSGVQETTH